MNYENFVKAISGLCEKYSRLNPDVYIHLHLGSDGLAITHGTKTQMRQEWVDMMLSEYAESYEDWSEVILCDPKRKLMVIRFEDCWGDNDGYGISKCSSSDEFDSNVGLAVAFAHFRGYEIPDFV